MRDLMVISSAGTDSDLLILPGRQRTKAAELAKKFDTAGLVYNITAMERLRWAIKNSDSPRALLEACLVRFALSEHFLNVDELLSKLRGDAAGETLKKKELTAQRKAVEAPKAAGSDNKETASVKPTEIRSIQDNWQTILKSVGEKLGSGTAGLLGFATPIGFENGVLTVQFAGSARAQKTLCESNGRAQQIEVALSDLLRLPVRLKLKLAENQQDTAESGIRQLGRASRRKNEIINDPAVKTVLMELGATITGIEED